MQKTEIIAQLQKDLLLLQGYKTAASSATDVGLNFLNHAFPQAAFPQGVIHEFVCPEQEDIAASAGFIAGITAHLMKQGGSALWIAPHQYLFPPALKMFGIEPHHIIFLRLQKEQEMLWALEEALKCAALAAVVAEVKDLSFTVSRRLQLAVESSRVTGFLMRHSNRKLQANASVARWKISAIHSNPYDELPGLGFPSWKVELCKIRNGKPGVWQVEWKEGRFSTPAPAEWLREEKRKTG